MIDFHFTCLSSRKRLNKPSVYQSVSKNIVSLPLEVSVAVLSGICGPIPARCSIEDNIWIDFNLTKKANEMFEREMGYGKVSDSHGRSILSIVLEPFQIVYSGLTARLILPQEAS